MDKLITKIMNQYWQDELSKEDIILQNHFSDHDIKVALEIALANQDAVLAENTFMVGYFFDLWASPNLMEVLKKLLLENWHHHHEDIVGLFQRKFNDDVTLLPVLISAIHNVPNYLNPINLKYPYLRKIVYAIGAQSAPYNINTLELLCTFGDVELTKLALHQIKKWI
jgi:hypothetical protein